MPLRLSPFPRARVDELSGDHLVRKAYRGALIASFVLLLSAPLFIWLGPIWGLIRPLSGVMFVFTSMLLTLSLIVFPLIGLLFAAIALFFRVESRFAPRLTPITTIDRVSVRVGMVLSFLPALIAYLPPIQALITGSVHFNFPKYDALRNLDPAGYWQAISIWVIGATVLAFVAVMYWRSRWKRARQLEAQPIIPKSHIEVTLPLTQLPDSQQPSVQPIQPD